VWTSPHLQVTVTPELASTTNSENENRIYFNPKADFSFGPSTTAHWLAWRRYNRSFVQDFTAYFAPYWQRNYGTGAAVSLAAEQRLKLNKRFSIFGKETWDSQPYDGSSEPYSSFVFGLKWGQQ
jgi:biofilm PGA synthesis protein PgaA